MLLKAGIALLVVCAVGCFFFATGYERDFRIDLEESHPVKWSERDVSHWLNTTVKYPEYHKAFKLNGVDGPTLFYLAETDIEFLGVSNPVHRAKLLAHLDVLRERCVCTQPSTVDFWEYLRRHPYRVLYLGALFEFSPRIAFAHATHFESELVWNILSHVGGDSYPALVYIVTALLFVATPHAALVAFGLYFIVPTNCFFGAAFVLSHYSKALTDKNELFSLLPELREPRYTFQEWVNFLFRVSTTRAMWLREMIYPLAFIILGPFSPYYATMGLAYLYMALHILHTVLYWVEKGMDKAT